MDGGGIVPERITRRLRNHLGRRVVASAVIVGGGGPGRRHRRKAPSKWLAAEGAEDVETVFRGREGVRKFGRPPDHERLGEIEPRHGRVELEPVVQIGRGHVRLLDPLRREGDDQMAVGRARTGSLGGRGVPVASGGIGGSRRRPRAAGAGRSDLGRGFGVCWVGRREESRCGARADQRPRQRR